MGSIMSNPSAFNIGRQIGNNFARLREDNAIESILSEAMQSNDPVFLQNSIGKILSQVSPERQGQAIQFLQNTANNIRQREAASKYGIDPNLPPALQTAMYKEGQKNQRIQNANNIFDGSGNQQPQSQMDMGIDSLNQNQQPQMNNRSRKDRLLALTGHPDREVSERAKAELKDIQHSEKQEGKKHSDLFKHELDRADKIIARADEISQALPQKNTALNLMEDSIVQRNLEFLSPDNLAEITGIEGFRSPEGAIFKTAGKEYFLGNISRAGARPNQWIEQQIADMMAKIGRTTEANLSVTRAFRNELDLDKERVDITNKLSDKMKKSGNLSMEGLGREVNKHMLKYAEEKQNELFNDLRAIKSISEKKPQKFHKVKSGTPVSKLVAQALLKRFNNDPKTAAEEARKLGYEFE